MEGENADEVVLERLWRCIEGLGLDLDLDLDLHHGGGVQQERTSLVMHGPKRRAYYSPRHIRKKKRLES